MLLWQLMFFFVFFLISRPIKNNLLRNTEQEFLVHFERADKTSGICWQIQLKNALSNLGSSGQMIRKLKNACLTIRCKFIQKDHL